MPPRNSNTKPFKRYRKYNRDEDSKEVQVVLENAILNPEKALNNKYNKLFEQYKIDRVNRGLDIAQTINNMEKEEGDLRYKDSNWYKERAKGEIGGWHY